MNCHTCGNTVEHECNTTKRCLPCEAKQAEIQRLRDELTKPLHAMIEKMNAEIGRVVSEKPELRASSRSQSIRIIALEELCKDLHLRVNEYEKVYDAVQTDCDTRVSQWKTKALEADNARVRLQFELEQAVKMIARYGEVLVDAGLPGGDRNVILANIMSLVAKRNDAKHEPVIRCDDDAVVDRVLNSNLDHEAGCPCYGDISSHALECANCMCSMSDVAALISGYRNKCDDAERWQKDAVLQAKHSGELAGRIADLEATISRLKYGEQG